MYPSDRLWAEKRLAAAHRALWDALMAAYRSGDEGLAHDLEQIQREVLRVHESLLKRPAGLR